MCSYLAVGFCKESMTQPLECPFRLPPRRALPPAPRDVKYLWRYQEAVAAVEATLLQKSYPGELWFVGELVGGSFSPKVSHSAFQLARGFRSRKSGCDLRGVGLLCLWSVLLEGSERG